MPNESVEKPHYRVLVVDDQAPNLRVASLMVEGFGHQAVTASSSTDALEIFEQDPKFDALITDKSLPNPEDGPNLAKTIREKSETIFIALISAEEVSKMDLIKHGIDAFIQKPVGKRGYELLFAQMTSLNRQQIIE